MLEIHRLAASIALSLKAMIFDITSELGIFISFRNYFFKRKHVFIKNNDAIFK